MGKPFIAQHEQHEFRFFERGFLLAFFGRRMVAVAVATRRSSRQGPPVVGVDTSARMPAGRCPGWQPRARRVEGCEA